MINHVRQLPLLKRRWFWYLLGAAGVVIAGTIAGYKPSLAILGLTGCLAFIVVGLCLKMPRFMFATFIFYTLFQDVTLYFTGSGFGLLSSIDLLDELLLIGLTINWGFRILVQNKPYRRTPIDWYIFVFGIYYFVVAIGLEVKLVNALLGFRDVIFYVLLFYAVIQLDFEIDFLRRIFTGLLWSVYIQTAVLILQWGFHAFTTGSFFLEDSAVALMGPQGAHKLGYWAGMLLLAYLGFYREHVFRQKLIILLLVFIIVISSTRAVLFYVPIAITVLFGRALWHRKYRQYWMYFLFLLGAILLGYLALPDTGQAPLDPQILYKQQLRGQETLQDGKTIRYTRLGFLRYTTEILQANNLVAWGVGPGWYASKTASRLGSPYYEALPKEINPEVSQLALTFGEYGVIGSILISSIYLRLYIYVIFLRKRKSEPYWRGIATATSGTIIFSGLSTLSINLFEVQQVIMIPWLLGGMACAIGYQSKSTTFSTSKNAIDN